MRSACRPETIVCALAVLLVHQVVGDRHSSQVVESPRVERSGLEMAQDCEGSWCKSQHESPLRTKLWFGPRLGRKRRSFGPLFPATRASAEAYDALLADLYSVPGALKLQKLTASPQGVIGAKEKRQETTFTPRLGRDLGNVYPIYDLARLLYEQVRELEDSEQEQQTPPPNFPPRLGRNLLLTESSTTGLAREQMLRYILQQLDL